MLCVGLIIHNCYIVIFTGKRTGQFFIDKSVSLTALKHVPACEKKCFIMVLKLIFFTRQSSSPQHLKYVVFDKNPNRLIHGALKMSMETRNAGNVDIVEI